MPFKFDLLSYKIINPNYAKMETVAPVLDAKVSWHTTGATERLKTGNKRQHKN